MNTASVTTTYLEMLSAEDLNASCHVNPELEVLRVEIPSGAYNRFFYCTVGADWHWTDRLPWSMEQWQEYAERADVETWAAYVRGTPAGYFELAAEVLDTGGYQIEIAYFGLMPGFIGQGIGGLLLTCAIRRAWQMRNGVSRVWVHTCSLDGPHALGNYQARGMRVYRVERE